MKKIGDITNTADKNGEFTDGNVAAGTPPTQLMGAWFNSVQREILNVLAKAGVPQSATKEDQLAEAITKMVASASYLPTGYSYSKTESDDRYQPTGDYATNTALTNGLNTKLNTSSIVQATGASTTTVMSQKAVTDALQNAVNLNTIYPVGIVVWFAQNKNPNTLFPGTQWQYIGENKTVRLARENGEDILTTGGSDSVSLTVANLPSHGHGFSLTANSFDHGTKSTNNTGAHTHEAGNTINSYWGDANNRSLAPGSNNATSSSGAHAHTVAIGAHSHTISGTISMTGSDSAVTIKNAYIMLMGWYRIA